MNYLPVAGFHFYGAASTVAMHARFASWGLLDTAPEAAPVVVTDVYHHPFHPRMFTRRRVFRMYHLFKNLFDESR